MNPASAKTSLDQVPALHKTIMQQRAFEPAVSVFDFGAGKEGKVDRFMLDSCFQYRPYDPFHRSEAQNFNSIINAYTCDIVLCANVLNVVEDEHLTDVLSLLAKVTCHTKERKLYLSVYHNKSLPANRKVGDHFQRNQPLSWYIPHLQKWFSHVKKEKNYLTCLA